ncbi:MAG TPA: hypothetical protein VHA74_01425 [Candidatus Dojkabacteria bacterium]|nr:hypothetical protein [Candidatus Dojkabacteria bacterium]
MLKQDFGQQMILPNDAIKTLNPLYQEEFSKHFPGFERQTLLLIDSLTTICDYAEVYVNDGNVPEEVAARCIYPPETFVRNKRNGQCEMNDPTSVIIQEKIKEVRKLLNDDIADTLELEIIQNNQMHIKMNPNQFETFLKDVDNIMKAPTLEMSDKIRELSQRYAVFTYFYAHFNQCLEQLSKLYQGYFKPSEMRTLIEEFIKVSNGLKVTSIGKSE